MRHVFGQIWINEGPKALLRGYWATIFGVIPYAGTSFFTFETLKRKHHGKHNSRIWVQKQIANISSFPLVLLFQSKLELTGEKRPQALFSLGYGALAGVIGQTTSYPLDIVRRRMQTVGMMKNPPNNYRTMISSLKFIYK